MDVLKGKKLKKKDIRVTLVYRGVLLRNLFLMRTLEYMYTSALVSIKDQEQKIKIITFRHRKKTQNF